MRFHALVKQSFDFSKSHVRERDHSRASKREPGILTGAQERRQRHGVAFHLCQNAPQCSSDAMGNERVIVAPKIDPRRSFNRNFVDQILVDFKIAFAQTFFADRIGGGVKKTRRFARSAELTKLRICFVHYLTTRGD